MAENTQVAEAKPQSFSVALSEKLDSISDALPKDFNKARFVQNTIALLNDNPQIAKYGQAQILAGVAKASVLGLDFYNKECYLIPYGNQLNYQTDYRGAVKLAKKYSIRPIKDIYAKIVREGDFFEESVVNGEPTINFKPKPFNDGKTIGAFAVCLFQDGGMQFDVMSLADLENTRNQSKAKNSPAWKNFTNEMYRKTVLHRLCKHIELEFENPTQLANFNSDMEIETDVEKQVQNDIEANANSVEFNPTEEIVVDAEVVEETDGQATMDFSNEVPFS